MARVGKEVCGVLPLVEAAPIGITVGRPQRCRKHMPGYAHVRCVGHGVLMAAFLQNVAPGGYRQRDNRANAYGGRNTLKNVADI